MGTAVTPIPGTRRTQATSTPTNPSTRQQPSQSTSRQQPTEPSFSIVFDRGICTVTGPTLGRIIGGINQTLLEMRNGGDGGDPDIPVNVAAGPGTGGQIRRRAPMSQAARQKLSMAAKARAAARKSQQAPEGHTETVGAKGTRKPKAAAATG